MKIANEDLQLYRLLKQLISSSKIEIEGKAVVTASLAFRWFEDLEKRIIKDLEPKKTKVKNATK